MKEHQLDARGLEYMRFDRESMKELVTLEYKIEKKCEDDLIASGFRIRKRIQVPKHLTRLIGKVE